LNNKVLILLVEDEALVLMTTEDILADEGFAVETATSAQEAIAKLEDDVSRFSAVVTDIRLGSGQDGWDVARAARKLAPSIPVVYASGDSGRDWAAQGVPGSMMLHKPYADAQLITAVSTLIKAEPGTTPMQSSIDRNDM
jgi:CheY-like chemotaxis protein